MARYRVEVENILSLATRWPVATEVGACVMAERGRPTAYKKSYAEQAAKLCALGATDIELADFFGVNTATIYRWRNVHEDFCEAVTCGKEKADERVARALFNRAVGYSFESEKVFQFQGDVIRAPTVEHVPPDPSAAKLWLTNRRPEDWREKSEVNVNVVDELAERMARMKARKSAGEAED